MASAALWGMSLALFEKATLKDGGIEQTNFNSYTPLRMSQVPEVAVSVIANGEHATGVGEPAMTVVALAIGNAVFNAVGARVRSLPNTAEAVKAAMKAQGLTGSWGRFHAAPAPVKGAEPAYDPCSASEGKART